jgi:hypothetical protein
VISAIGSVTWNLPFQRIFVKNYDLKDPIQLTNFTKAFTDPKVKTTPVTTNLTATNVT